MEISISGRHFSMGEVLKTRTETKLRNLIESLPIKATSAKVVFDPEGEHEIKVGIVIHAKEHVFESDNIGRDADTVFDITLDKVAVQMTRYLDKKQDHYRP